MLATSARSSWSNPGHNHSIAYEHAVIAAFSKYGIPEEELDQVMLSPVADERRGKFAADRTRPQPVRLIFNTPQQKRKVLAYAKELRVRQAGFKVDDDLTRAQQIERRGKGHQPYFRASLLKYYSGNKIHSCDKEKADRIPAPP